MTLEEARGNSERDIMALPMMLCTSSHLPANLKQGAVSNHLGRSRDLVSIRDEPGRDCLALFTPSTHQLP